MALDISRKAAKALTLTEALTAFDRDPPSIETPEARDRAAAILAGLALDRECVAAAAVQQIRQQTPADPAETASQQQYGPQVLRLGEARPGWFLRANIWPARADYALRASGEAAFSYGLAHDHNFDFLTIGYHGPGYVSDYYEQDYDGLAGHRGEAAGLRFVERSALHQGRILHYRRHRDVHCQYPPEQLSISINLMFTAPGQHWQDQYRYDLEAGAIEGIVTFGASDVLCRLAVNMGMAEGRAVARDVLQNHPSQRLRGAALHALYGHFQDDDEARKTLLDNALAGDSALLAGEAKWLLESAGMAAAVFDPGSGSSIG